MRVPHHIAIIMDGNGRWAEGKGLSRPKGHQEGSKRVKEVVRQASKSGVKVLTLFAFSTENWKRPRREIKFIFSHAEKFLSNYKEELVEKKIKFKVIGRRDRIEKKVVKKIQEVEEATSSNREFFLNIALDYGGRWDIVNAAARAAEAISEKRINKNDLNQDVFAGYLSLADFRDPDIVVRASGEKRLSNFLIWQTAYSEFYFPGVLWPEFGKEWVDNTIKEYSRRKRKFGKINA